MEIMDLEAATELSDRDPAPASNDVHYLASYTCTQFHRDESFVRALVGPLGSGKSVACCAELIRLASQQTPGPDGIIRQSQELQGAAITLKFVTDPHTGFSCILTDP